MDEWKTLKWRKLKLKGTFECGTSYNSFIRGNQARSTRGQHGVNQQRHTLQGGRLEAPARRDRRSK